MIFVCDFLRFRDVISASWWLALTRNSSFTINNCLQFHIVVHSKSLFAFNIVIYVLCFGHKSYNLFLIKNNNRKLNLFPVFTGEGEDVYAASNKKLLILCLFKVENDVHIFSSFKNKESIFHDLPCPANMFASEHSFVTYI